ncbi:MAG: aminotransferase class I/II-fold pyridoxal phosphate-dependent enzyme [Oscillospiraceae bacterium]|nr:aminotransferase class I/II-fold pyridoxal phosphate-dependent enzyme [Oscillospiraceae bacterium]
MDTPIYDFLKGYVGAGYVRAHMPGHKGKREPLGGGDVFSDAYSYDITEISGADSLFEADGIILKSEENAARLFGSARTLYSTSGSTLCIQAMLALVCGRGEVVAAARNCHSAFVNVCVLLGLRIKWIYPNAAGVISAKAVEEALESEEGDKPSCVYVTSPDYLGRLCDVSYISEICKKHGVKLAVDNAHGAYLSFIEPSEHPICLGADICCDSAHKTLPVLTGGAYLHIGDMRLAGRAKEYMRLFASTSPSYIILQSLDLCNSYLDGGFRSALKESIKRVSELRISIRLKFKVEDGERLKIAVYAPSGGYTGYELSAFLRNARIEPEYADLTHVVLMFSACSTQDDFERVRKAFEAVPESEPFPPLVSSLSVPRLESVMTVRDAFFSDSEEISVDKSVGRICSKAISVCPPGVVFAAPGEVFSDEAVLFLKSYSIFRVNVVK